MISNISNTRTKTNGWMHVYFVYPVLFLSLIMRLFIQL